MTPAERRQVIDDVTAAIWVSVGGKLSADRIEEIVPVVESTLRALLVNACAVEARIKGTKSGLAELLEALAPSKPPSVP